MTAVAVQVSRIDVAAVARAEQRLLNAFWSSARTVNSRRELLQEYTFLVLRRPDGWSPAALRVEHADAKSAGIQLDRTRCFACSAQRQLYRHHIIELQYGGSNTVRNQVPLCFDCHQFLHPWLTDTDRAPGDQGTRGLESLREILARGGGGL